MKTIETERVDGYVQSVCSNTALPVEVRAINAATAIHWFVMQEHGLLIDTRLPIEDDLIEWHEAHLESTATRHMNELMADSWAAFMAIEDAGSVATEDPEEGETDG